MNDDLRFGDLIRKTLGVMVQAPGKLAATVEAIASAQEIEFADPLGWLQTHLTSTNVNSSVLHSLGISIRLWDRAESGVWIKGTTPFSEERRGLIYARMGLPLELSTLLATTIPIFQESDRPIVVAEQHLPWYHQRALTDGFYWKAYAGYLQKVKHWEPASIAKLDHSTDEVVSRLSDPCRNEAYSARGLVVGYVQSGKTANFTGVLAKAADAGYRFIIVLAGTLDILRSQTQRRLDKELIGQEMVGTNYQHDDDWNEFQSFGGLPSEQGAFDWERLTGPEEEYRELKLAIAALDFKAQIPGKPYNDPDNLRKSPVRILVIKKIPKVMERVSRDLAKIQKKLANVPTLIVDDESDQASINTLIPNSSNSQADKDRTSTNGQIVHLLKVLPRAQYIGYTATPFANVFVDPSDAEDLFPKDFIISLPRPESYMGVMDFYDWDSKPDGFDSNESAFVRNVRGDDCGGDLVDEKLNPNHVQNAIDSFVLAGAIKLYREKKSRGKYKYKHHTMLVHHSVTKADHEALAKKVRQTFNDAGYHAGQGYKRLEKLLKSDFLPVSAAKGKSFANPKTFTELAPFVGTCLAKLNQTKTVLIVNGDNKDDTPDFDKSGVWAILVGGTKLSRGYTVEGLTTTYFRRVSTTTDTLMQMGRWFGYRPGYGDLVRSFLGRDEPFGNKGKTRLDLYQAFEAICRDEEKFRQEIRKYQDGTLTPKQIPPLVPSHLTALRPVAKNKMYNARITFKNFGGDWSESTVAPNEAFTANENANAAMKLLKSATLQTFQFTGTKPAKNGKTEACDVKALCGVVSNTVLLKFLDSYKWKVGSNVLHHECEFIRDDDHLEPVKDWLIVAPLLSSSNLGLWPTKATTGVTQIPVQKRTRVGDRFGVYTTSSHRAVADYIASISDAFKPSSKKINSLRSAGRGVMLFYPVQAPGEAFTTIGFALAFPKNSIPKRISYSVKDPSRPDAVVVPLVSDPG